jgi:hypothetical protein
MYVQCRLLDCNLFYASVVSLHVVNSRARIIPLWFELHSSWFVHYNLESTFEAVINLKAHVLTALNKLPVCGRDDPSEDTVIAAMTTCGSCVTVLTAPQLQRSMINSIQGCARGLPIVWR